MPVTLGQSEAGPSRGQLAGWLVGRAIPRPQETCSERASGTVFLQTRERKIVLHLCETAIRTRVNLICFLCNVSHFTNYDTLALSLRPCSVVLGCVFSGRREELGHLRRHESCTRITLPGQAWGWCCCLCVGAENISVYSPSSNT